MKSIDLDLGPASLMNGNLELRHRKRAKHDSVGARPSTRDSCFEAPEGGEASSLGSSRSDRRTGDRVRLGKSKERANAEPLNPFTISGPEQEGVLEQSYGHPIEGEPFSKESEAPDDPHERAMSASALESEAQCDAYIPDRTDDMTSEAIIAAALTVAPRSALLRHPHLRRIYLTVFILFALLILVPSWGVWYAYRPNRPRRSWTVQRCLRVRWSRLLCGLVARCEIDYLGRDLSVAMLPEDLKWSHPVTIPAAPSHFLRGHAKVLLEELHESRGEWVPRMIHRSDPLEEGVWGRWNDSFDKGKEYGFADVVGFWYTGEKSDPSEGPKPYFPGDPVGLHFHGGGYLCGTAAETDLTSSIPKTLVGHSPMHHILSIDYRLAPSSPWPLPLLDAISSYLYLVTPLHQGGAGVAERDIIIFGDSAGGHLALALVRWLRDEGVALGLQMPRGVVLMSPWVDVGFTTAWGAGKDYNKDSDTIDDTFGPFASSLLFRAIGDEWMHESAYLSPGGLLLSSDKGDAPLADGDILRGTGSAGNGETSEGLFEGYPPTFVVYGGAERLGPSIRLFYNRLCRDTPLSVDQAISVGPSRAVTRAGQDHGDDQSPPNDATQSPVDVSSTDSSDSDWHDKDVPPPGQSLHRPRSPQRPHKILVGPDAVHDFLIFPWMQEESAVVYRELDVWLRELLGSDGTSSDSDTEPDVDDTEPYEPIHLPEHTKAHLVPLTTDSLQSPTVFMLDEPTSPPTPFAVPTLPRPGMGRRMSSIVIPGPATPLDPTRGDSSVSMATASAAAARARAQQHRRTSRRSILVDRSPVIEPHRPGVRGMVHDMRAEAMTYLSLDGESSGVSATSSGMRGPVSGKGDEQGWLAHQLDRLTPFTAQLEKGEWDWEMEEAGEGARVDFAVQRESAEECREARGWYEMDTDTPGEAD